MCLESDFCFIASLYSSPGRRGEFILKSLWVAKFQELMMENEMGGCCQFQPRVPASNQEAKQEAASMSTRPNPHQQREAPTLMLHYFALDR